MDTISRKTLLDWLDNGNAPGFTIGEFRHLIQSGRFDVPSTESEGEVNLRAENEGLRLANEQLRLIVDESIVCPFSPTSETAIQPQKLKDDIVRITADLELEYGYGTIDIETYRNILADRIVKRMQGIKGGREGE